MNRWSKKGEYRRRPINCFTSVFCPFTKVFINSRSTVWRRLQRLGFGIHATPYHGRMICITEPQRLVAASASAQRKFASCSTDPFEGWAPALRTSLGELLLSTECVADPAAFLSTVEMVLEAEQQDATASSFAAQAWAHGTQLAGDMAAPLQCAVHRGRFSREGAPAHSQLLLCPRTKQRELVDAIFSPSSEEGASTVMTMHVVAPTSVELLQATMLAGAPLLEPSHFDAIDAIVMSGAEFLAAAALELLSDTMRQRSVEGSAVRAFGGLPVIILADLREVGCTVHRASCVSALFRDVQNFAAPPVRAFYMPVACASSSAPQLKAQGQEFVSESHHAPSALVGGDVASQLVPTRADARRLEFNELSRLLNRAQSSSDFAIYDACLLPITLVGEWSRTFLFRPVHQIDPRTNKPLPFPRISLREIGDRAAVVAGAPRHHVDVFSLDYGASGDSGVRVSLGAGGVRESIEQALTRLFDVLENEEERVELLRRNVADDTSVTVQEPQGMTYPNNVEQLLWGGVTKRWPRMAVTAGTLVHFTVSCTVFDAEPSSGCGAAASWVRKCDCPRTVRRGQRAIIVGFDRGTSPLLRPSEESVFLAYQDQMSEAEQHVLPIVQLLSDGKITASGSIVVVVPPVRDQYGGHRGVHNYVLQVLVLPIKPCRFIPVADVNDEAFNHRIIPLEPDAAPAGAHDIVFRGNRHCLSTLALAVRHALALNGDVKEPAQSWEAVSSLLHLHPQCGDRRRCGVLHGSIEATAMRVLCDEHGAIPPHLLVSEFAASARRWRLTGGQEPDFLAQDGTALGMRMRDDVCSGDVVNGAGDSLASTEVLDPFTDTPTLMEILKIEEEAMANTLPIVSGCA